MASAVYSIFTSPLHEPVKDHLPTLIVCPHGRPNHILYTYLHTNLNQENYLLTPSEQGDLCVAKLFPPSSSMGRPSASSSSSHGNMGPGSNAVRCEASRNLKWSISNTGIQNPVYKLTLPNPDLPQQDQPLFQVSKPNPNATWWTLFYFTYAGHLIPPKRVEFGRIQKNSPESGGGTRVSITGKTEEEKAVWKTLGEGNEDMVEWVVLSSALTVVDSEIIAETNRTLSEKVRLGLTDDNGGRPAPGPSREQQPYHIQPNNAPHSSSNQNQNQHGHHNQSQQMPPPPNPRNNDPRSRSPMPPNFNVRPEPIRNNSSNSSYSGSAPPSRQQQPDPRQQQQQQQQQKQQQRQPDPRQQDPRLQQRDPRQDSRSQFPNPPPREDPRNGNGMDPRDPRYPQWVAQQQQQQQQQQMQERERFESQQRSQSSNSGRFNNGLPPAPSHNLPPPSNLNGREMGNRLQRNR